MTDTHRQLHVIDHPIIADMLRQVRDRRTSAAVFRRLLGQVGALLAYEATRDLPTEPADVDTPLETMAARRLRMPVTVVPILRAGLGMADGIHDLLPDARFGHIGLARNEQTLQATSYYQKLPADIAAGPVLLVDPMLATGGSAASAAALLRQRRCPDIRLICLVAAPEGVQKLTQACPDIPIYSGALDRQLNEKGYILPGLGDAGDRLFGTEG